MRRILSVAILAAGALMAPAAGVLAAGATAVGAAAPAPSGPNGLPPGLGIRLAQVPANLAHDPRALQYIIDHVGTGATIHRRIEVSDGTDQPMTVRLYAGPATITNGTFSPEPEGKTSDLSRWTSVAPDQLTLAPGEVKSATVTIAVPATASNGERYGVVWAELPPRTPPGGGLAVVDRVGIRIYLSVGNGPPPVIDFRIASLQAKRLPTGQPEVWAQVHNIGGRALDMTGSLQLQNGPGGVSAGPFPAKLGTTLAIGATEPVTILLDPKLPAGPWQAVLTLQSDEVSHRAEAQLTFPAKPDTSAAPVAATSLDKQRAFLLPLALALLVVVIVGLGLWFFLLGRRRQREEEERRAAGFGI